MSWTAKYDPEAFTPRRPTTCPGNKENDGTFERLRGTRDPAPNRREVSIARLVAVGRAVVVGGSKQILPTTTISF